MGALLSLDYTPEQVSAVLYEHALHRFPLEKVYSGAELAQCISYFIDRAERAEYYQDLIDSIHPSVKEAVRYRLRSIDRRRGALAAAGEANFSGAADRLRAEKVYWLAVWFWKCHDGQDVPYSEGSYDVADL